MNSESRPDPDALLAKIQADEAVRPARLKIFFGCAPGVGKTYAMLESAGRLWRDGVDLVVGCVETHGRQETAGLLQGLPVLPLRYLEHRGGQFPELDLEAALTRRPRVILVDELAHSNIPGSRHTKRWQDVMELLEAGIDVHTTLNVQHLESLNDIVAQITGVRVKETLPDAVLERADEIELVDIPPEELLTRLEEGKVYLPSVARVAAERFFRRGNILALRELALRRTAERVDIDVRAYRTKHGIETTWPITERILVCVGPAPASAKLVRAASRIAASLRVEWIAAYVDTPGVSDISSVPRQRLEAHLRLAESLGAEVVRLSGHRIAETVLAYARPKNVTRILIGKPTHPRWRDWLGGSVLVDLIRDSGPIDIHVISGEAHPVELPQTRLPAGPVDPRPYFWALLMVGAATGLSFLVFGYLAASDIIMVYLLEIMLVAVWQGRGPSIFAAALSVASFDFCFVPPYYTFAVSDTQHLLSFAVMFAVGVMVSGLTVKLRGQELDARRREQRTAALYALSKSLGHLTHSRALAAETCRHLAEVFSAKVAILLPDAGDILAPVAQQGSPVLGPGEIGVARWSFEHGQPAGRGTQTLPGSQILAMPLVSGSRNLGVVVVDSGGQQTFENAEQRHLLETFARQAALALERTELAQEAKEIALKASQEELRSSLLSAVSHDLRTPLAAITGAATTLRDAAGLPDNTRQELLATICEEAVRQERLVTNLMEMTRIEAKAISVHKEWVPLDEIVGSALNRTDPWLADRSIEVEAPAELPLLYVDPLLIEQVLLNLLENAAKYTPKGSPVQIKGHATADALWIEVADRGPGLPAGQESRIFEKFFRGHHPPNGGVGLGLAICRGIVEAHGGKISAENRPEGGALFKICLPRAEPPPLPPEDWA